MPSWDFVRDNIVPILLHLALPALAMSAVVMAAVDWLGGSKHAGAGAALAIAAGSAFGLAFYAAAPFIEERPRDIGPIFTAMDGGLSLGQSSWSRLTWAVLAALLFGRIASPMTDGWLVRCGVAIPIAWAVIPEQDREEIAWIAPLLAAGIAALWIVLERSAQEPAGGSVAIAAVLALLTAAQIAGAHAHSARIMIALFALGFALAGLTIVALRRRIEFCGALPAVAVALPTLMLMAQRTTSSKLPWIVFALPAIAPLLAGVTLPVPHWPRPVLIMIRMVLVLAALVLAAGLAWLDEPVHFGDGLSD